MRCIMINSVFLPCGMDTYIYIQIGSLQWTGTKPVASNQLLDMNSHEWSWQRAHKFQSMRFRIVDALLGGHTNFHNKRNCSTRDKSLLNAPYRGDFANCLTSIAKTADISELLIAAEQDMADIGIGLNPACSDALPSIYQGLDTVKEFDAVKPKTVKKPELAKVLEAVMANLFTDAVGKDNSCAAGCPNFILPHCKEGVCVRPSCADAVPFCNELSKAGRVARMFCSLTCGCDDVTSSLVLMAPKDGCPRTCEAKRNTQLEQLPCADARPGDQKLVAFTDQLLSLNRINQVAMLRTLYGELAVSGCSSVYDFEVNAKNLGAVVAQFHPCRAGVSDKLGSEIRLFEHFCPGMHALLRRTRIHAHACTCSGVSLHGAA